MTDDDRERIINEARDTLRRLDGLQVRERETSFDKPQWQPPEPEPDDVVFSEPVITRSAPAPAIEPPSEDYISELLAAVVAELTATYDRKIERMQSEIDILKADRSFEKYSAKLDQSIRSMDALTARFDRGHERSGQVIDLPPLPTRRSGMN
jgi:hypothetical protein